MLNKELIDRAWACLPREFREEVKKEYYDCKHCNADACAIELERLFGKHNLTSDAEGEEMLYCERDTLMMLYRKTDSVKARRVLESLFGSKCLPDENSSKVERLEKNGKDSSKPKPAEPKFKVGDIVRFKYCCTTYQINGFKISDGVMLYQVGEVWAEESDLEPYTEPDTSLETPVCENHSDNTSQKEVNMNTNRNLSLNIVDCDKLLDNILKDSFRNGRRLNIATTIMSGVMANPNIIKSRGDLKAISDKWLASRTLELADTLIAECEEGGNHEKA